MDIEKRLENISKGINKLVNIQCCGDNSIVVRNYQPLSCSGEPIGPPIDVMPTISVAKQDSNICNYQQLAQAIADAINLGSADLYNVPFMATIPTGTTSAIIADLGLDITKLHSISFAVLAGTVDISGNLGGGTQSATGLPATASDGWQVTTVFGTGDLTFTTDGSGIVLVSATSKA